MIEIDHLAVAGETLDEAVAHVEATLGVALEPGGVHVEMGTHNRLLSLGPGMYLEAIAINPAAKAPQRPRWFDLDRFEGRPRLANWIVRTTDMEAALQSAPGEIGVPIPFQRGKFSWTMAVPGTGRLPYDGAAPALIAWDAATHPADLLPDAGCRLERLEIGHPEAAALLWEFPALENLPLVDITETPEPRLAAHIRTPLGLIVLR